MPKPFEDVYRPCPCGSGQKYKFCCLPKDREERRGSMNAADPILFADLDEGERLHQQGFQLMAEGRIKEAISAFEASIRAAPFMPQPYNNLALAHFAEGDIEKAVEIAERVDRVIDPGNVFAVGNLLHFQIVLGRNQEAMQTAKRLCHLTWRDEHALAKKCEALSRLRWHEEVFQAATRGLKAAEECRSEIAFFAGVAAANLGRYDEALRHLKEAVNHPGLKRRSRRYVSLLERRQGPGTLDGDWPYLEFYHWLPPGLLQRMTTEEDLRKLPGVIEAMMCLLNDRSDDDKPLLMLAEIKTPEAINVLRKVAFGTFGSDDLRMKALMRLQEMGEVSEEGQEVWLQGEWQEMESKWFEITGEVESWLPESLLCSLGEMLSSMRSKDWKRAERIGRDLLGQAPKVPQVLYNLAMAVRMQKQEEESEELLKQAIALDPSYLFAPAALATIRLHQGRTEEARQILRDVRLPEKMTHQAYASFLLAEARVLLFEGEFEKAMNAWEMAEEIDPDSDAVLTARKEFGRRYVAFFAKLTERRREIRKRQRLRLLTPNAGLDECFGVYRQEQLRAVAKALGWTRISGLKKDDLRKKLVGALKDTETVRRLVESLPQEALEALRDVRDAGYSVSYERFTRAHGSDEADFDRGFDKAPETPLGRLKALGLLVEGTVGGRESVLIPMEIRDKLGLGHINISSCNKSTFMTQAWIK